MMRLTLRWGVALLLLTQAAIALRSALRWESHFHVSRARPALPDDLGHVEEVSFRTLDGLRLDGWFVPPAERGGAAVVFAHGVGQGRAGLLPEARLLVREGFGVLLFDMRGHGTSEGDWTTMGQKEVLDVHAAADWLRARSEVDPTRVGAIGFSIGANAVVHAAAADPLLRAVVLLSPVTRLREDIRVSSGRLGPAAYFGALLPYLLRGIDVDAVRPLDVLPSLAPRHVLLIEGGEDPEPELVDQLVAALPRGSSHWIVPGGGHGDYFEIAPIEYEHVLLKYLDDELGFPRAISSSDSTPDE